MAQSIIVIDATVGGASTNSYLSLEEMEDIIHQRPFHGAWDKINKDDEKKAALVWATRILSHLKWDGLITYEDQAQAFPRSGLYDFNHREYLKTAYPEWIKIACSELTFINATKDILADSDTVGFKAIKVGSLSMTIDTEYKQDLIPTYIMDAIAPWLSQEYSQTSLQLGRS